MIEYSLKTCENICSVEDFTASCVDVAKFLDCCRKCSFNYEKNWMCPPFDFDPMSVWRSYRSVRLTGWQLAFDKTAPLPADADPLALAVKELKKEKARMLQALLAEEQRTPGSLCLLAGSCELCPTCARIENKPCRHPEAARHSLEALGADVSKAAKQFLGIEIKWAEKGVLPDYLTLVGALLLK